MPPRSHLPASTLPSNPGLPETPAAATVSAAKDAAADLFGDPVLGYGFDRIVSATFKLDPLADYALVEQSIAPKGQDVANLINALDASQTAARTAHRLLVNATLAYEQAKGEVATIESGLRARAKLTLEQSAPEEEPDPLEKKGKPTSRRKAITNDDVTAEMHRLFPIDTAANRTRLAKAKGTVEHLEALADLAKSRIRTLEVLVGAARR